VWYKYIVMVTGRTYVQTTLDHQKHVSSAGILKMELTCKY